MPRFRIRYVDPASPTNEEIEVVREFHDTAGVSARDWAEDWAYTAADKGPHSVELLPEAVDRFHLESTGPDRFRLRTRH